MSSPNMAGDKTSEPEKVPPLPIELWGEVIINLPMQDVFTMRKVNHRFRSAFEEDGQFKYRLDCFNAGLDSNSYLPVEMRRYYFRWNKFGKSEPISVDLSQHNIEDYRVKKGHLVSVEPRNNRTASRFHFTRLPVPVPSPLTEMKPSTNYWAVDIPVSQIRAWDICPFSGLFAVATVTGHGRDRELKVKNFWMKDGKRYRGTYNMTFSVSAAITSVDLLLTSHRVVTMVQILDRKGVRVHVWNWEDGHPHIENDLVSDAKFIDEYRLLCVIQEKLVLWDFSAKDNPVKRVKFQLEKISIRRGSVKATSILRRSVKATGILRSYDLNNAQPFRANPEEGIVLVTVKGYPGFDALVIPTKVFTRSKAQGEVRWEEWNKFAIKFQMPPGSSLEVFHTHILCLKQRNEGERAHVGTEVFDFSPYCREEVTKGTSPVTSYYWPSGVEPCVLPFDTSRPLAVTLRGGFDSPTPLDDQEVTPTENGILVVKPGPIRLTGTFYRCNDPRTG